MQQAQGIRKTQEQSLANTRTAVLSQGQAGRPLSKVRHYRGLFNDPLTSLVLTWRFVVIN